MEAAMTCVRVRPTDEVREKHCQQCGKLVIHRMHASEYRKVVWWRPVEHKCKRGKR